MKIKLIVGLVAISTFILGWALFYGNDPATPQSDEAVKSAATAVLRLESVAAVVSVL